MAFLKSILITVLTMLADTVLKYLAKEKLKAELELAKKEVEDAETNDELREAVDNDDSYSSS